MGVEYQNRIETQQPFSILLFASFVSHLICWYGFITKVSFPPPRLIIIITLPDFFEQTKYCPAQLKLASSMPVELRLAVRLRGEMPFCRLCNFRAEELQNGISTFSLDSPPSFSPESAQALHKTKDTVPIFTRASFVKGTLVNQNG